MQIKNVIIINDFNYIQGGASKVAIDTAKLLKEYGLNVIFFSAVNKVEENIDGITYVTTEQSEALKERNKLKGFLNGIYNIKARKKLKVLLSNLDKDETVIHVHGWTKALSSSIFGIIFKMKFKMFLTMHDYFSACPNGGYFNYKKNCICNYNPLSLKCIFCNCDSRNYLFKIYRLIRQFVQNKIIRLNEKIKYVIGISDLNIKILKKTLNNKVIIEKIYNPINVGEKNQKIKWQKNTQYLYVGRVCKEKGVEIFCKAITELKLEGIVVGDGNEREKLEKLYPSIKFVGWKNNEEVKDYMKKARCLILPSLWYEGAPLTPLEAMYFGIPCLISDYCAAREYVDAGNRFKSIEELKKIISSNSYTLTEIDNKYLGRDYIQQILKFYERE